MSAKCHFAHGKEELRNMHDALPANTPYITDPKPTPNNNQNIYNGMNNNTKNMKYRSIHFPYFKIK